MGSRAAPLVDGELVTQSEDLKREGTGERMLARREVAKGEEDCSHTRHRLPGHGDDR